MLELPKLRTLFNSAVLLFVNCQPEQSDFVCSTLQEKVYVSVDCLFICNDVSQLRSAITSRGFCKIFPNLFVGPLLQSLPRVSYGEPRNRKPPLRKKSWKIFDIVFELFFLCYKFSRCSRIWSLAPVPLRLCQTSFDVENLFSGASCSNTVPRIAEPHFLPGRARESVSLKSPTDIHMCRVTLSRTVHETKGTIKNSVTSDYTTA